MSLEQPQSESAPWRRVGIRAGVTIAVLAVEAFVLLVLVAMALGASGFEPQGTPADAQPRLEEACRIGFWAVPACFGVAAAWRRYWVIVGVQVCLLIWQATHG